MSVSQRLEGHVFVNGCDLMPFVSSVVVDQPTDSPFARFEVTFRCWHFIPDGAQWDIYAGPQTEPPNAQGVCLIRNGYAPPEAQAQPATRIVPGQVPTFTVVGYDFLWVATRRRPRTALVFVPSIDQTVPKDAAIALADSDAVGRYRIIRAIRTMHAAARKLGAMAGVNVQLSIPNYPMRPWLVKAGTTYWDAIAELVNPFAPCVSYSAWRNELLIEDSMGWYQGAGSVVEIPAAIVDAIEEVPRARRQPRTVRVRSLRWR